MARTGSKKLSFFRPVDYWARQRERARARETRVSPSRAPVFSLVPTTSKRLLRRLPKRETYYGNSAAAKKKNLIK